MSELTASMKRQLMPLTAMERCGDELVKWDGVGLLGIFFGQVKPQFTSTSNTKLRQR
jgi:hypothetical protein